MILAAVDGVISARTRSGMPRYHTSVVPRSSMALSCERTAEVASAPVKFKAPGTASTTSIFMSFIATVMAQSRAMIRPRRGEDATRAASMPAPKATPLAGDRRIRSEGGPGAFRAATRFDARRRGSRPVSRHLPRRRRRLSADDGSATNGWALASRMDLPRCRPTTPRWRSVDRLDISVPLARMSAPARISPRPLIGEATVRRALWSVSEARRHAGTGGSVPGRSPGRPGGRPAAAAAGDGGKLRLRGSLCGADDLGVGGVDAPLFTGLPGPLQDRIHRASAWHRGRLGVGGA